MGMNLLEIAAVGVLQGVAHGVGHRRLGVLHQINQRQGWFAFGQIVAHVFADFFDIAGIIQHIINNLESGADVAAVVFQRVFLLGRGAGQNRAHLCGGFKQFGGFVLDHLHIFGFGDVGVADIHQLQHFTLGDDVGGISHHV